MLGTAPEQSQGVPLQSVLLVERRGQTGQVRGQAVVQRGTDQQVRLLWPMDSQPVDQAEPLPVQQHEGWIASRAEGKAGVEKTANLVETIAVTWLAARHGNKAAMAQVEPQTLVDR